jgi:hypothetical protein
VCFAALALAGCRLDVISHDERMAASEAGEVLRLLYLRGDYVAVHERLSPELRRSSSTESLRNQASLLLQKFGKLRDLRPDSYTPVPGQRAINIFLEGKHEKAVSYHRILLTGDARGYKVSGLWVSERPYPPSELRRSLDSQ